MKGVIALLFYSFWALASPKEELAHRLALINEFSAQFQQSTTHYDKSTVSESKGKVHVKRPDLFRWEAMEPEKNLMISNKNTFWYYIPSVNQVSIYNTSQMLEQTPFTLLVRKQEKFLDGYLVSQKGNQFTLVPVHSDPTRRRFTISISKKGLIRSFKVVERDGLETVFDFKKVSLRVSPPGTDFNLIIPDGVAVDDQR